MCRLSSFQHMHFVIIRHVFFFVCFHPEACFHAILWFSQPKKGQLFHFCFVFTYDKTSVFTTLLRFFLCYFCYFCFVHNRNRKTKQVNLGRSNGWRFWRMDPEVLSMSDASKSVSNALHKLYLWDFASYSCFVLMCTLAVCCLGYFWLIPDLDWKLRPLLR